MLGTGSPHGPRRPEAAASSAAGGPRDTPRHGGHQVDAQGTRQSSCGLWAMKEEQVRRRRTGWRDCSEQTEATAVSGPGPGRERSRPTQETGPRTWGRAGRGAARGSPQHRAHSDCAPAPAGICALVGRAPGEREPRGDAGPHFSLGSSESASIRFPITSQTTSCHTWSPTGSHQSQRHSAGLRPIVQSCVMRTPRAPVVPGRPVHPPHPHRATAAQSWRSGPSDPRRLTVTAEGLQRG